MNPRILALALGVAVGYVLGTRAGREQYDKLKAGVTSLWEDPRVAKARKDVEVYARQQAPIIRERAEAAAKAAPGFVADTAKDVADKVSTTAKDVAENVQSTAKDVAEKVSTTAKDATTKVTEAAGAARDKALHIIEDDDDPKTS